ncbi:MAG: LysE family transporter [Alphaproteobacteria bacterium]|nr:LysE family transporter [Alphaproteobacteria bacterium]
MFEHLGVLYRGLILGLMIAAPVGPIGLLCMRRTIQRGPLLGLATGFGSAFTDAFFASIAALGISQITEWITKYNHSIHIIGGVFLFAVAIHSWFDRPHPLQERADMEVGVGSALKAFISGIVITMTNPVTLFGTLAVVAAFGELRSHLDALTLVAGIFLGATGWWVLLNGGISLIRHHFTENTVLWVNRITAIGLIGIAGWALSAGVLGYLFDIQTPNGF